MTLREKDRLQRKASWAIRRSGLGIDVANARGVHKSQITRSANGQQSSPEMIALTHVRQLGKGKNTTPLPMVMALWAEAKRVMMEDKSDRWLIARYHELRDNLEPMAEAREEIASRGACRKRYRDALLVEAEIQVELVAVDEELERRGIEPRDFRGDGHLIVRPR